VHNVVRLHAEINVSRIFQSPGRTGVQDPKDPVDDRAVVTWRAAHLTGAGPLRKQNRDAIPLLVR